VLLGDPRPRTQMHLSSIAPPLTVTRRCCPSHGARVSNGVRRGCDVMELVVLCAHAHILELCRGVLIPAPRGDS
jgi:hypothetical protein